MRADSQDTMMVLAKHECAIDGQHSCTGVSFNINSAKLRSKANIVRRSGEAEPGMCRCFEAISRKELIGALLHCHCHCHLSRTRGYLSSTDSDVCLCYEWSAVKSGVNKKEVYESIVVI